MSPPKPKSRRGYATVERYGNDAISRRAREGLIARYLRDDALDPSTMRPADLEAYRKQVPIRAAAKARAAKALQDAVRRAEREAMAEAEAAQKAAAKAQAKADHAHEEASEAIRRATTVQMEATAAAMHAAEVSEAAHGDAP